MDLKKAFDSVWHEGLLYKLWTKFGIRGKMWRLTKLLLDSNFVRVEINRVKTSFSKIDAGTRQGGKCSPLLFNIYIDDYVEVLEETECGISLGAFMIVCLLYADDIVLFAKSPKDLERLLTTSERWARKWRLSFNVPKCKILVISASRAMQTAFKKKVFKLCGEPLEIVKSFVYLGMETNARLTLTKTPKLIREKVEKRVNFLRWVSASNQGLRSELVLPLFSTIVRPLMTVNARYTK